MEKSVEYKIISRSAKMFFEGELNDHISKGWKIKGNISTTSSGSYVYYSILLYRKMKFIDRIKKFLKL